MVIATGDQEQTERLPVAQLALLAFAAMCVQDLLATVMVVFESHYDAVQAGLFDCAQWFTWLISSAVAIDEVLKGGWRSHRARIVIVAISVANFCGTVAGVYMARVLS